jgi:hypothetical protein
MANRQKFSLLLLAVAMFCIMTTAAQAATADSFQSPLDSYVINNYAIAGGNNQFGKWLPSKSLYHAGEDLSAVPLTPVYAIANGQVKFAREGVGGYGQAVVIEHKLPDNTQIISIYGHLSKKIINGVSYKIKVSENQDVTKGTLLGYTGYKEEIVEGEPHLHFGIKKGKYANLLEGRINLAGLANFYKPSDFLNLVRTVNTNDVYRLSDLGSKAYVSAASFTSCGWRPIDVRPVSSTEMSRHSTFYPQAVCFAPGTFIKRANHPEISMIRGYSDGSATVKNNFRQPFSSESAYLRYGGKADYSNVKIVSDYEYNLHVQGATLS